MRGRKAPGKLSKRRQDDAIKESITEACDPLLMAFTTMNQDVFKEVGKLSNMTKPLLNEMKVRKKCRCYNHLAYNLVLLFHWNWGDMA